MSIWGTFPNSKVHVANMGPIWGRHDPGGPHVGPMNFAIWVTIWNVPGNVLFLYVAFSYPVPTCAVLYSEPGAVVCCVLYFILQHPIVSVLATLGDHPGDLPRLRECHLQDEIDHWLPWLEYVSGAHLQKCQDKSLFSHSVTRARGLPQLLPWCPSPKKRRKIHFSSLNH